jgi:hypothetical protein
MRSLSESQLHLAAVTPQILVALVQSVAEHYEIANALDFAPRLRAEPLRSRVAHSSKRENLKQAANDDHYEVSAGGFERLDEAARQADGDAGRLRSRNQSSPAVKN